MRGLFLEKVLSFTQSSFKKAVHKQENKTDAPLRNVCNFLTSKLKKKNKKRKTTKKKP